MTKRGNRMTRENVSRASQRAAAARALQPSRTREEKARLYRDLEFEVPRLSYGNMISKVEQQRRAFKGMIKTGAIDAAADAPMEGFVSVCEECGVRHYEDESCHDVVPGHEMPPSWAGTDCLLIPTERLTVRYLANYTYPSLDGHEKAGLHAPGDVLRAFYAAIADAYPMLAEACEEERRSRLTD